MKTLQKQDGKSETIKSLADASYVSYRHTKRCLNGDSLKAVLVKIRPGRSARIVIKRKENNHDHNSKYDDSDTEVLAWAESGDANEAKAQPH